MRTKKLVNAFNNYRYHRLGRCTICCRTTVFVCLEPDSFRNSMICLFCRSASRNRHVAKAMLNLMASRPASIAELSTKGGVTIYNTATDDCFSRVLKEYDGYFSSCYRDGVAPGTEISSRSSCQNIEA